MTPTSINPNCCWQSLNSWLIDWSFKDWLMLPLCSTSTNDVKVRMLNNPNNCSGRRRNCRNDVRQQTFCLFVLLNLYFTRKSLIENKYISCESAEAESSGSSTDAPMQAMNTPPIFRNRKLLVDCLLDRGGWRLKRKMMFNTSPGRDTAMKIRGHTGRLVRKEQMERLKSCGTERKKRKKRMR